MKRLENAEMRDAILDSVISCKIAADGSEVSLSQISCGAGVSERTVNRYFPDKDMMVFTAAARYLKRRYDAFAAKFRAVDVGGMNGLERILLLLRLQADANRSSMPAARTFIRAYITVLRTAIYRKIKAPTYDAEVKKIVAECIKIGKADGSIGVSVPSETVYTLLSSSYMGLLQQYIYSCTAAASEDGDYEKAELNPDAFIAGIKKSLAP
ncbi:MAG: TetR/AcrR family transcriptional regulator [Eubacteriales bacterium]|nr:TetR/AcrR family transcriptional regulator [Eubacteriales bacterium]MDD3882504.1 TetR/AcrR family transcriptional regulator [Eubacteriales bacterium]MDD4512804.1 TetR/AcrR family transcriptional regulator [Eubacteriales bacterium]